MEIKKYPDLKISLALGDLQQLAWGMAKNQQVLGGLLERFIAKSKKTGVYQRSLLQEYGFNWEEYQTLLGTEPGHKLPFSLTDEEQAALAALKAQGGLRAVTYPLPTVYEVGKKGIGGFHYRLLQDFAKTVGIPVTVDVTYTLDDLWKEDGKSPLDLEKDKTKPNQPDLMKNHDLYLGAYTIKPWRARLVDYIPIIPNKQFLVCKKGQEIQSLAQLGGKKVAVLARTSYKNKILEIQKNHAPTLQIISFEKIGDYFSAVTRGEADFTISDLSLVLSQLKNLPEMTLSLPVSSSQPLCWAAGKNRPGLISLINKYLNWAQEQGVFSQIWGQEFPISFSEYLDIIGATH